MKKSETILIRALLILVAWSVYICLIYADFDRDYFTKGIVHAVFLVLASVVSLVCINIDYEGYKRQKSKTAFISTALTVISSIALYGTLDRLKEQDRTTVVFHAFKPGFGGTSFSIDFRGNGTYKCRSGNFLGSYNYTRGRYTVSDSIVTLDKSNLYNLVISKRLLLKTIPKADSLKRKQGLLGKLLGLPKPDTTANTYLFQLDKLGDTISSAAVLKVNWMN
jgi:hypothetical protein